MSGYDRYEMKGKVQKYFVIKADKKELVALAKSLQKLTFTFVSSALLKMIS